MNDKENYWLERDKGDIFDSDSDTNARRSLSQNVETSWL